MVLGVEQLRDICVSCPCLNVHWERADICHNIDKNVSANEICSWYETDKSQEFVVLWALWALPSQLDPRVSLGNRLGVHSGV